MTESGMSQLYFINPSVIERIQAGTFVPNRRSQPGALQMQGNAPDRRDTISPLAVTRRCVRYDPQVFEHRKAQILQVAGGLNNPEKKIILVGGPQGSGKTSLARGIIELMSAESQQLLWYDANRHTDFEEIIQFLIHYMTYVCTALKPSSNSFTLTPEPAGNDPFKKLEALIRQVSHIPFLIVIDNVEYLVDAQFRFNSYPFKEILNFLLSFPNIKMLLLGERLPYTDMSPNQAAVTTLQIAGLDPAVVIGLLQKRFPERIDAQMAERLFQKTQGAPWLLRVLLYLNKRTEGLLKELEPYLLDESVPPVAPIIRAICRQLSDVELKTIQTLALVRHPVSFQVAMAMTRFCHPQFSGVAEEGFVPLDESLMKPFLKMIYPPQEVLEHVRTREEKARKFEPWYEFYHEVKKVLYHTLPEAERIRIHGLLQDFYLAEKKKEAEERLSGLKNKSLFAEAKFHGQMTRSRKSSKVSRLEDLETGNWMGSKAYLYQSTRPLSQERTFTLDDYRQVSLPGEPEAGDPESEFRAWVSAYEEGSDAGFDEGTLELTPEEKKLLTGGVPSPGDRVDTFHPTPGELIPLRAQAPEDTTQTLQALADAVYEEPGKSMETVDPMERAIQQKLATAVANLQKPQLGQYLLELAQYRISKGLYERAEECLEKALSLKKEMATSVLAEIYRLQGTIHKELYRHNSAVIALMHAAEYLEQLPESAPADFIEKRAEVYQDLAEIYAYRKQPDQAGQYFLKALTSYQAAGIQHNQSEIYFKLGNLADDQNHPEEAIQYYQKSLELDKQQGNHDSCAAALANMGIIYEELGQEDRAIACFQDSLGFDKRANNWEGQIKNLESLATLFARRQHYAQASECHLQALNLAIREENKIWQARIYLHMGELALEQEAWQTAMHSFQAARSSGADELSSRSLNLIEAKIQEVQRVLRAT